MTTTTIGVKVTDEIRARLKQAAERIGRSPHWLIKHSVLSAIERIERGERIEDALAAAAPFAVEEAGAGTEGAPLPFIEFAQSIQPQSVLRATITAA
jgi:RHH-type transcriptional regulator, proline utilization regulon repressor / proline dehydrogenase / delta 1-pyrroline-5-carboxylate dehydrogenase